MCHAAVGVGWGGSCSGGVCHVGVGCVMQGWGVSCRGGVGCVMQGWGGQVGVGWVIVGVNGEHNRCYSYLSLDSE